MREKLLLWEGIFVVSVCAVGSLLHFVYRWSGKKLFAGFVSPVNESTWEHLKLLFFPSLLFGAGEYLAVGKEIPHFLPAKAVSILAGMGIIVVCFYTYTGILGTNWLAADILTFFLGVVCSSYFFLHFIHYPLFSKKASLGAVMLLAVVCACFFVFTFSPPRIGLFRDPAGGGYGIQGK